jgi:hypothetical protein
MVIAVIASLTIGVIIGAIIAACAKGDQSVEFSIYQLENRRRQGAEAKLAIAEEELRRGCRYFRGVEIPYKCGYCYPCAIFARHFDDYQCKQPRAVEKGCPCEHSE